MDAEWDAVRDAERDAEWDAVWDSVPAGMFTEDAGEEEEENGQNK